MLLVIPTALFISFLWGLSPVIHKYLLSGQDLHPETMLVIGGTLYSVCLVLYGWYKRKLVMHDVKSRMTWKSWLAVGLTSIVCGFVANMLYFFILKKHTSYIVSALIYASPLFTLILALLFLKEKVTAMGMVGVFFIVMGVVCIAFHEAKEGLMVLYRSE